ncbi:hypothetical protein RN001_004503, partial [Aquatica leii]
VSEDTIVPPNYVGFVECVGTRSGDVYVDGSLKLKVGDERHIPRCVIQVSTENKCRVPVTNLTNKDLLLEKTSGYRVGVGIGDITGPIVEVNFLGYANPWQIGSGLHLRQYARAYVIEDDPKKFAFVSIDTAMIGYFIKNKVLDHLKTLYGDTYSEQNLILSAIHTHSGPGGYMCDAMYDVATAGLLKETISVIYLGIIKAIVMAHTSLKETKIFISSGILLNANINRSPLAYLLNHESERNEYLYNVDKEMVQLKFIATESNKLIGLINWFPVHPNSMNSTNTLVSSDNVGYASVKLEQHFNQGSLIGKGPFIASFASTNLGDVSPNIKGPYCINTGLPCDDVTSSCNKRSQQCIAFGPGNDMFESTEIIATRLYTTALEILQNNNHTEVTGKIQFGHKFVDMSTQQVNYTLPNGTKITGKGCVAAVGYSFAAGTTDGPGKFNFIQSTTSTNPFWNLIRTLLAAPTANDIQCQNPKPILFNTGRQTFPYQWQPNINSVQIVILGDVILAAVPSEFTTMSGRRLKKTLKNEFLENTGTNVSYVIIAGLSNSYSSYVTTYEEYQMQRYEGASTLYGPHTLAIYEHLFKSLLTSLLKNELFDKGSPSKNYDNKDKWAMSLPIPFDINLINFGTVLVQPKSSYKSGETVTTVFKSSNPRNGDLSEYTLLAVKKFVNSTYWETVATDANWETKYQWKRVGMPENIATITWYINLDVQSAMKPVLEPDLNIENCDNLSEQEILNMPVIFANQNFDNYNEIVIENVGEPSRDLMGAYEESSPVILEVNPDPNSSADKEDEFYVMEIVANLKNQEDERNTTEVNYAHFYTDQLENDYGNSKTSNDPNFGENREEYESIRTNDRRGIIRIH